MCGHLVKEAPPSGFKRITGGSHLCSGQLSSFTSDSNTWSSHPRQWWTKVLKLPTSCQIKNYFLLRLMRSPFSGTLLANVNTKLRINKKLQQGGALASYKMTSCGSEASHASCACHVDRKERGPKPSGHSSVLADSRSLPQYFKYNINQVFCATDSLNSYIHFLQYFCYTTVTWTHDSIAPGLTKESWHKRTVSL